MKVRCLYLFIDNTWFGTKHGLRCRKRKGTYSKVGDVFAVAYACVCAYVVATARAHDSLARGQSLLYLFLTIHIR